MAPVPPLPDALKNLPKVFSKCDPRGIAPDVRNGVAALVRSAWEGSLRGLREGSFPDVPGVDLRIPLATAVRSSTAELDMAAMAFSAAVLAEMTTIVGPAAFDATDATRFSQVVVRAFANLKNLSFEGMRLIDWDNLQTALTMNLEQWRSGPRRNEVFVVQQFCLRMVQFFDSFRQRTGCSNRDLEAAVAAVTCSCSSPSAFASQENRLVSRPSNAAAKKSYESEPIVGGLSWPACKRGEPDWVRLFGSHPWLTPRMAYKMEMMAYFDVDTILKEPTNATDLVPRVARPFFLRSKAWRFALVDCYVRIALRLRKGLEPCPNCIGEEVALRTIMVGVNDVRVKFPEFPPSNKISSESQECSVCLRDLKVREFATINSCHHQFCFECINAWSSKEHTCPICRSRFTEVRQVWASIFYHRDCYWPLPDEEEDGTVLDNLLEDEDALFLYDDNGWYGKPGSLAGGFVHRSGGEAMRGKYLHPSEWFLAFQNDRFANHR